MKQNKTIRQLDKELVVTGVALFVLAAFWLAPTVLYYLVKRTLSLSQEVNATYSAEFIKGVFDRLDIAFFVAMPVFCLSLILF